MDQFRYGVIGLDSRYQADPIAAYGLRTGRYRVTAVADRLDDRLQEYAERYAVERRFSSVEAMLAEAEVDAVVITNRTSEHADAAVAAARAHRHILTNKPIATTLADADRMVDAAKSGDVRLGLIMNFRYHPGIVKAKELLEDGIIGDFCFCNYSSRAPLSQPDWFYTKKYSGGGAWLDHASHTIDAMLWMVGKQVSDVSARLENLVYRDLEVDDYGIMTAGLEGGGILNIESTWTSSSEVSYRDSMIVGGSEGEVLVSTTDHPRVLVHSPKVNGGRPTTVDTDELIVNLSRNWQDDVCAAAEAFATAVQEGRDAPIPGEDGREVLRIMERAHEAAVEGRRLSLKGYKERLGPDVR